MPKKYTTPRLYVAGVMVAVMTGITAKSRSIHVNHVIVVAQRMQVLGGDEW